MRLLRMLQVGLLPLAVAGVLMLTSSGPALDQDDLLGFLEAWHTGDTAVGDLNGDGEVDYRDLFEASQRWQDPEEPTATRLVETSPFLGEEDVAVTRETILRFSGPLDPDSVDAESVFAEFGGAKLDARLYVSVDRRTVTLFYSTHLPASARIRVTVDGDRLRDADGRPVDADGDTEPGGQRVFDFTTLTLTTLPGTAVYGRVFASEFQVVDGEPVNRPLEGVRITVDGREQELFTYTDAGGNFRLEPAPAGRFFVHVDGRSVATAVVDGVTVPANYPFGPYYPFVGKPWDSIPGEAETSVGDAYLPVVLPGTLQPVSELDDTTIPFPESVLEQFPEFEGTRITVLADSLFADNGTRGGSVGIAPVPPDRLPGPLPTGLEFPLVITVQTDGPTNFDRPAPVCFPNLDGSAPGAKRFLYSFDHDKGRWDAIGLMTVSEDGRLVCTDDGVGILAPGWHGVAPPPIEPPPPQDCGYSPCPKCTPFDFDFCVSTAKRRYALAFLLCAQIHLASLAACLALLASGVGAVAVGVCYVAANTAFAACQGIIAAKYQSDLQACRDMCIAGRSLSAAVDNRALLEELLEDDPASLAILLDLNAFVDAYGGRILSATDPETLMPEVATATENLFAGLNALAPGGNARTYLRNQAATRRTELRQAERTLGEFQASEPPYPILYAAQILRGDEILELRGTTEPYGQYRLFNPDDGELNFIAFYDPRTRQYGQAHREPDRTATFGRILSRFNLVDATLFPDSDEDGLPDPVEYIYATDPGNPDTDGDGLLDGFEVEQGLNPLGVNLSRTGIIATVDTREYALDVCAVNDRVYVAVRNTGVAVFNVYNGMNPAMISLVPMAGGARALACQGDWVAAVTGAGGIVLIDMGDPTAPAIRYSVMLNSAVNAVAISRGYLYAGLQNGELVALDMLTGVEMDRVSVAGPAYSVQDLGISSNALYALLRSGFSASLASLRPLHVGMLHVHHVEPFLGGANHRMRLFVGTNIAYAVLLSGYATLDIRQPEFPQLIARGETAQLGWRHVVDNGSGLGVAVVGPNASEDVQDSLSLYDVSNPLETNRLLAIFETPGVAQAVTIYNGIAYVADRHAGLQMINYRAFDAFGAAPSIELQADFLSDPSVAYENRLVHLVASATDDVQVRSVEFYLQGEKIGTDGNYPFEQEFRIPLLIESATFSVQARVFDTGGNWTWSEEHIVEIVSDTEPPLVLAVFPRHESDSDVPVQSVIVRFNKEMDPATLNAGSFLLVEAGPDGELDTPDDRVIVLASRSFRPDILAAFLTPDVFPLLHGTYRATLTTEVSDILGIALADPVEWTFRITDTRPPQVVSVFPEHRAEAIDDVTAIEIRFDEPMAPASFTQQTASLFSAGADGVMGTADDIVIPWQELQATVQDGVITLLLPQPLPPDRYGVVLDGVEDANGNALAQRFEWTFTVLNRTTLQGIVQNGDGSPATGAVVVVPGTIYETVAGAGGAFTVADLQSPPRETLLVIARMDSGGRLFVARAENTVLVHKGVTDVGVLTLSELCDQRIMPGLFPGLGPGGSVARTVVFDDGAGAQVYAITRGPESGSLVGLELRRWNGVVWSDVPGAVFDPAVRLAALTVFDDGSGPALYVGGRFSMVDGKAANNIARWTGQEWQALGDGLSLSSGLGIQIPVETLAVIDDGVAPALHAGGVFDLSGDREITGVARWDGQQWTGLGDGLHFGGVDAIAGGVRALNGLGGWVVAGGLFLTRHGDPSSVDSIAVWDGNSWESLGGGIGLDAEDPLPHVAPSVHVLHLHDDGNGERLYAGGTFSRAGAEAIASLAVWDGAQWSRVGETGLTVSPFGRPRVLALASYADSPSDPAKLYAGGNFSEIDGVPAGGLARWDGDQWLPPFSDGPEVFATGPGSVHSLLPFDDGSGERLFIGGGFTSLTLPETGGSPAEYAIAWDGMEVVRLGSGMADARDPVRSLALYDDGRGLALYAGGGFQFAGQQVVNGVARWNGITWEPLGAGLQGQQFAFNGTANVMAVYQGELIVGGQFVAAGSELVQSLARWDGQRWSPLGGGLSDFGLPEVYALQVVEGASGPVLFVGGRFNQAGGQPAFGVAQWDGEAWTSFPGLRSGTRVNAFTVLRDEFGITLYVGGSLTGDPGLAFGNVGRLVNGSWRPLPGGGVNGAVNAMASYIVGGRRVLVVGGFFSAAGSAQVRVNHIAQWQDGVWSDVGGGFNSLVRAMAVLDDGLGPRLYIGGGEFANPSIWDGVTLTVLDPSLTGISGSARGVYALLVDEQDITGRALYLGGLFSGTTDGIVSVNLARLARPSAPCPAPAGVGRPGLRVAGD